MRRRSTIVALAIGLATSGCFLDGSVEGGADGGAPDAAAFDAGDRDAGSLPDAEVDAGLDAGRVDAGELLLLPGAPSRPSLGIEGAAVRVTWDAPLSGGPVETYEVERAPDEGGTPGTFAAIASGLTETTLLDETVARGPRYHYRVLASNAAGSGPPSPPSAIALPLPPAVVVQRAVGDGGNPRATFPADPIAGHLLIAVATHRKDDGRPTIEGWTVALDAHYAEPGNTGNTRRGLAVLYRFADGTEGRNVDLDWPVGEGDRAFLHVRELDLGAISGVTVASSETERRESGTSVSVTSAAVSGDVLVLGALGARDDPGSVMFDGLDDVFKGYEESVGLACAQERRLIEAPSPITVDVRWENERRLLVGLVVFALAR